MARPLLRAALLLIACLPTACAAPADESGDARSPASQAPVRAVPGADGAPAGLADSAAGQPVFEESDSDPLPPYEHQDEATRNRIARLEGYFPDPVLITQDGERVHFYEEMLRGRCVLIQFMYTSCTGT